MEKILTVNDVAAVLQVKAITVREMFREKRLRGFKVGKSWRTTEVMLQEDINALARGEAPAELPAGADVPARPDPVPATMATEKPAPKTPPPAPEVSQAPRVPKKSPAPPVKEGDDSGEDTQQLLF
jgi:excisionase family DNA binding protein